MELIGESIRAIRRSQGRSLESLAEQIGLSIGYLSRLERGQKSASDETIESLALALGVPLRAIVYPEPVVQTSRQTVQQIVEMLTNLTEVTP